MERLEIHPAIVPISKSRRSGLGHKGVVLDHLNRGDKITFKGRSLDNWRLTIKDVGSGNAQLQFGNFQYGQVKVFDATNAAVLEDNKVINKKSPNYVSGKIFTLDELALQFQTTPDALRGRNIGIVFCDGQGGELKMFLDYSCPSSLNNGDECAIGFIANNCDFNLEEAKVIEAKNELVIPLI